MSARFMALVAAWLVALGALGGCDTQGQAAREYVADAIADDARARAASSPDAARRALVSMFERAAPEGMAPADVAVIRRDACDRIARVELAQGSHSEAERWLDRGLAIEAGDDVFAANLWTTHGRLREAQGRDAEAAADYHRALIIEEALLDAALGIAPEAP